MKPIQFGTKAALKASTPTWIKTIYRTAMSLSGTWAGIALMGKVPGLSEHALFVIGSWVTIGNLALYQFCQAFGYAETESETPNGQG